VSVSDLVASAADAIGSVANYYQSHGWKTGGVVSLAADADAVGPEDIDGGVDHLKQEPGAVGDRSAVIVAALIGVVAQELLDQETIGGVKLDAEAALTRARDLSLTWEPEDLSDRVELEIYAGGAVLSCSARDDGQFVLPHAKLASLEQDAHGSLVLRRVRVMFTDMQGIETAYVRIATTRTLPIQVE